jgi:hypothetical protein
MKTRMLLALARLTAGCIITAFAQTTAKDLVGTWTLVSLTLEKDDATIDLYGPNTKGWSIRDADGHVAVIHCAEAGDAVHEFDATELLRVQVTEWRLIELLPTNELICWSMFQLESRAEF